MQTSSDLKLAPPSDLREARLDRQDRLFYQPARSKSLALALVDAAIENEKHPLAFSIGRAVKVMK